MCLQVQKVLPVSTPLDSQYLSRSGDKPIDQNPSVQLLRRIPPGGAVTQFGVHVVSGMPSQQQQTAPVQPQLANSGQSRQIERAHLPLDLGKASATRYQRRCRLLCYLS
jgi:hypothetical protein